MAAHYDKIFISITATKVAISCAKQSVKSHLIAALVAVICMRKLSKNNSYLSPLTKPYISNYLRTNMCIETLDELLTSHAEVSTQGRHAQTDIERLIE